jgi:hypothetical protein
MNRYHQSGRRMASEHGYNEHYCCPGPKYNHANRTWDSLYLSCANGTTTSGVYLACDLSRICAGEGGAGTDQDTKFSTGRSISAGCNGRTCKDLFRTTCAEACQFRWSLCARLMALHITVCILHRAGPFWLLRGIWEPPSCGCSSASCGCHVLL